MLGERLKQLRKKMRITQEQAAAKTGIPRSRLSQHELNIYKPNESDLLTYADLYNTTTDYLLGRTDNPETDPNTFDLKEALRKGDRELVWNGRPLSSADQEYLRKILDPILDRLIKEDEEND